ncbi:hypothetical protein TSTA_020960 [Talaromyces stipitatus ATCC 10500]|uniref:Uncharacterized protein n=1 Tax=Talaromyces stipitatus (strain ATCC 10500 / CBS 375.48 / QM 6759 / NRRL 1006) TaxID=441959 RepID=B8MFP8_TALSN|nr:uncharacterized protein TSTA_020960 [Talaromyces stipitatus ATCC 10500]EED17038.1 hypothetical protein TSTA_020960 [Talaromyces stipitatus ATCC 10500]
MDGLTIDLDKLRKANSDYYGENIWRLLIVSGSSGESESDSDEENFWRQGQSQSDLSERNNSKNDDEWDKGTEHCVEVLSLLLENCNHDISVNAKDKQGLPALHIGSIARDSAIVEKLLNDVRDIEFNAKNSYVWTPLHKAAFYRYRIETVKALRENGRNIDWSLKDGKQRTAVELANGHGLLKNNLVEHEKFAE